MAPGSTALRENELAGLGRLARAGPEFKGVLANYAMKKNREYYAATSLRRGARRGYSRDAAVGAQSQFLNPCPADAGVGGSLSCSSSG